MGANLPGTALLAMIAGGLGALLFPSGGEIARAQAVRPRASFDVPAQGAMKRYAITKGSISLRRLVGGSTVRVAAVIDGDTLRLDDGRSVRLTGIQTPKPRLVRAGRRPGFTKWPLADAATKALTAMALGKTFRLYFGGARADRYGRVLAHMVGRGGLWLQGRMVRLGLARVYTLSDNRALAHELYLRERAARKAKLGIWSNSHYAVRNPVTVKSDIGSFQVVGGLVRDAVLIRKTVYLNFGANWRIDFSVKIRGKALKMYRDTRGDPVALKGRLIRVRGWVKSENGPMIVLSHPEALEVVPFER